MQVVEEELRRIPPRVARRYTQQLWSITYIPQAGGPGRAVTLPDASSCREQHTQHCSHPTTNTPSHTHIQPPPSFPQVGYVMQVTGRQLSEELLELMPDYELAWSQHDSGDAGGGGGAADSDARAGGGGSLAAGGDGGGGGIDPGFSAFYRTASTARLSARYGDLMYRMKDLEVAAVGAGLAAPALACNSEQITPAAHHAILLLCRPHRAPDLPHVQCSICTELIRRLLVFRPALQAASAAVAELDCQLALAGVAREYGYCRPVLVEDSVLEIRGGGRFRQCVGSFWLLGSQSGRTNKQYTLSNQPLNTRPPPPGRAPHRPRGIPLCPQRHVNAAGGAAGARDHGAQRQREELLHQAGGGRRV
jgi:hypothetical protein